MHLKFKMTRILMKLRRLLMAGSDNRALSTCTRRTIPLSFWSSSSSQRISTTSFWNTSSLEKKQQRISHRLLSLPWGFPVIVVDLRLSPCPSEHFQPQEQHRAAAISVLGLASKWTISAKHPHNKASKLHPEVDITVDITNDATRK